MELLPYVRHTLTICNRMLSLRQQQKNKKLEASYLLERLRLEDLNRVCLLHLLLLLLFVLAGVPEDGAGDLTPRLFHSRLRLGTAGRRSSDRVQHKY